MPRHLLSTVVALLSGCTFDSSGLTGAPESGGVASSGDATTSPTSSATTEASATTGSASGSATGEPLTSGSTGPSASCGDGKLDPGEECDLGVMNGAGQACKGDCTDNVCGDGDKGPGEGCEDGNLVDGDGCSASCVSESCGDGKVDPGEGCDDGNMVEDDGCTNACTTPVCGDAIVQVGEKCDDGGESADCNSDCTTATCGDGTVNMSAGEQCDDGNATETDACAACKAATCGDGFVQMGVETCDDGNMSDGDGCSAACKTESLRAFVSSTTYKGGLGGLAGADMKCQTLADAAKLGGTWMAWLSDDTIGPADRFTTKGGNSPYVLVDGTKIADDWADLVDGTLDAQLNRTQSNVTPAAPNNVWTNTDINGKPSSTDRTCNKWTDQGGGVDGDFGERNQSDGRWTKKGAAACIRGWPFFGSGTSPVGLTERMAAHPRFRMTAQTRLASASPDSATSSTATTCSSLSFSASIVEAALPRPAQSAR